MKACPGVQKETSLPYLPKPVSQTQTIENYTPSIQILLVDRAHVHKDRLNFKIFMNGVLSGKSCINSLLSHSHSK